VHEHGEWRVRTGESGVAGVHHTLAALDDDAEVEGEVRGGAPGFVDRGVVGTVVDEEHPHPAVVVLPAPIRQPAHDRAPPGGGGWGGVVARGRESAGGAPRGGGDGSGARRRSETGKKTPGPATTPNSNITASGHVTAAATAGAATIEPMVAITSHSPAPMSA